MLQILFDPTPSSRWTAQDIAHLDEAVYQAIPLVTSRDIVDILPGLQLWDCWPFETPGGETARVAGGVLWVIMCAPREIHPDLRHDVARLRLALERDGEWLDCGYLLPDGLNPGSREWAGSTVLDPETGIVTLFYTVTGRRGEAAATFEQRLFQTSGRLDLSGERPRIADWRHPEESVAADGVHYMVVDQAVGTAGFIKGFRDPFHFRDPADGADYLLFTGSCAASTHAFNGVIGMARARAADFDGWELLPPVVSADGLNNEMERPVLRCVAGRYYLFWSTQRKTFAPDGPSGPNGLYGMVADSLGGPWRPLNGTGLVAPNPPEEPYQTYSWWVMDNLEVAGFVDLWNLAGRLPGNDPEVVSQHFGGVLAPRFRIALDGDRAGVVTT